MTFEEMGTTVDNNIDREMDWDSVISTDPEEFTLAPAGDYDFTIVNLERKRYNGGAKIPASLEADVTIQVITADGKKCNIINRLYLHRRTEGLLAAFFIAIGQKKHGEPLKMDWSKVVGSTGRCKVGIREYKGVQHNEISRFYDPNKARASSQAPATKPFVPGKF